MTYLSAAAIFLCGALCGIFFLGLLTGDRPHAPSAAGHIREARAALNALQLLAQSQLTREFIDDALSALRTVEQIMVDPLPGEKE